MGLNLETVAKIGEALKKFADDRKYSWCEDTACKLVSSVRGSGVMVDEDTVIALDYLSHLEAALPGAKTDSWRRSLESAAKEATIAAANAIYAAAYPAKEAAAEEAAA